jgi:hypothetical protein
MDESAWTPILAGIARHALTTAGGALVTDGVIQSSQTNDFVGAGMVMLGIGWSWWNKSGHAQVAAALKRVTAAKTVQEAINTAKIVPPGAAVRTGQK